MSSSKKKILLQLEVGEPKPITDNAGVFVTELSHPDLEGTLTLVHGSSKTARSTMLKSLDVSILGDLTEMINLAKETRDEFFSKPKTGDGV